MTASLVRERKLPSPLMGNTFVTLLGTVGERSERRSIQGLVKRRLITHRTEYRQAVG